MPSAKTAKNNPKEEKSIKEMKKRVTHAKAIKAAKAEPKVIKTKSKVRVYGAKEKPVEPAPVKEVPVAKSPEPVPEPIVIQRAKLHRKHAPIMAPVVLPVHSDKRVEGPYAKVLLNSRASRRAKMTASVFPGPLHAYVEVYEGDERNGKGIIITDNSHLALHTAIRYAGGTAQTPAKLAEVL